MKKEDTYYERQRKRGSGLPTDDLEKKLEEFKSKLRKELAEEMEKEKKKKGK